MRKRYLTIPVVLLIAAGAWCGINPPGRFGICMFGCTTYGCVPRIAGDIQVRCDGALRKVDKTHALNRSHIDWLLEPLPGVLIIGTGWQDAVNPDSTVRNIDTCEVRIVTTGEAVKLFNQLKKNGHKVAIHVHSTC